MEWIRFANSSQLRRRYAQRPGRGLVEGAPGDGQDKDKNLLLIAALDHAWHWHELRITCGLQVLNFYLLAIAVLITAYVSALNARNYTVSVAVALAAAGVTGSTYMVGARQDRVARMALIPIQEVEERIAAGLEIASLRLTEQYEVTRKSSAVRTFAYYLYPVIIVICIAAAIYAALSK